MLWNKGQRVHLLIIWYANQCKWVHMLWSQSISASLGPPILLLVMVSYYPELSNYIYLMKGGPQG